MAVAKAVVEVAVEVAALAELVAKVGVAEAWGKAAGMVDEVVAERGALAAAISRN